MTELDELKQRLEIEELRGRLSAAEKQISILTDTLATLTEIQTSDRLGSYINSQVRLLKAAEFLNSVSDGEKIAPQLQRQSVEQAGIRKAELDEHISRTVQLSKEKSLHTVDSRIANAVDNWQSSTSAQDPKLFTYGVESPMAAIENLTATTLRNIIGDLELDETLTSREIINTKMQAALDIATDPWGIKVNRVELKNIMPPAAIQEAMEKQMKAERERREAILIAEGEKKSTILVAEGKKQSAILDAEAEKQAAILRAEAEKEKRIREAEGQAEAILKVQQANADGIRAIKEAGADDAVLTLKSLEALGVLANGKATKIVVPSDLQGLASLATTFKGIVEEQKVPAGKEVQK